ncbi:transposase [Frankia sp. AgPm24]|uniref:transposase n=1 Tax=Frankia sp. AgPm24 TaxID=631128 RepID=UPI00200E742B|nr:transposase [Frankia sp. AgPm24]MCK9922005.1 transposase [Frankia sp. AgPm24]
MAEGPLTYGATSLATAAIHQRRQQPAAGLTPDIETLYTLGESALAIQDIEQQAGGAPKEYGALRRTIYAARYLSDPAYRRKISRQLNKGESLHALKRDLLYAHEGTIRARHLEAQTEQAWCLTLVTNAVVAWTTGYYGLAVDSMRAAGRRVDDEVLMHISPAHSGNINFFGAIEVDIEGELAQLGPTGYRPLRVLDTLF